MSELPEKDISNLVHRPVLVVLYNKLPRFVSELPGNDLKRKGSSIGSILQEAATQKSQLHA